MHKIPQENSPEPTRRGRLARAALVGGILALVVAASGCGGQSKPGVAAGVTTTIAAGPSAGGSTHGTGLVAYSACMRSHGVPSFPDPSGSGGLPKGAVVSAQQAVGNSTVDAAQSACRTLLPAGGSLSGQASEPVTIQDRQDYLEAAACMRSHGFGGFPDPTFRNNSVQIDIPPSIDQDSPQFKSAAETCTKLVPSGLPYSRPSGS